MRSRIKCIDNYTVLNLLSSAIMSLYYSGAYEDIEPKKQKYIDTQFSSIWEEVTSKKKFIVKALSYIIIEASKRKNLHVLVQDYSLVHTESILVSILGSDMYEELLKTTKSFIEAVIEYYGFIVFSNVINYLCNKSNVFKTSVLDYIHSFALYSLINVKEV